MLIDVRTPAGYDEAHVVGSQLFPLTSLGCNGTRELDSGKPIVVVCRSGSHAREACVKFARQGLKNATVLGRRPATAGRASTTGWTRTSCIGCANTRECLWIEADTSLPGARVARVLDQLVELRG